MVNIRQSLMSLDTKQKLAVVAVIGGLVTLPVVYASRNSTPTTENPADIQRLQASNHSGSIVITNTNDGKVTTHQDSISDKIIQLSNQNQSVNSSRRGGEGPAAGLDYPRNESLPTASFASNSSNYAPSASCNYYSEAGRLGIYHFSFPEASSVDLVTINGYKVNQMAAEKLRQMIADARNQGVTLTIGSAFRSVDYQRGIVQRKKAAGQSARQIYFVSSHPGFSEHHTGLAIDFTPINHGFAKTAGFGWLKNNAYKYGFEQTFTPDYSRATGVSEESWHWKYTGSAQAKAMLANSQCYLKPKSDWHPAN